jgi:predicted RNase H-like HicB family nuclease
LREREFQVFVHEEGSSYWAEVAELPGCFASGDDLDELREAVIEAITLYLADEPPGSTSLTRAPTGRVGEMRVLVSA